jgi:hypothetical protein
MSMRMNRPTLFQSRSQIQMSSEIVMSVGNSAASPRRKNRRKSSLKLARLATGGE